MAFIAGYGGLSATTLPAFVADEANVNMTTTTSTTTATSSSAGHPRIYTYYERIPLEQRTTGMEDEDDVALLAFWNETWLAAGFQPVVLGGVDVEGHHRYEVWKEQLQSLHLDKFGQVLFHRWIAMASVQTGGWYSDYDNFPLRPASFFLEQSSLDPPLYLPNKGRMTLHDLFSPTLATGTQEEWSLVVDSLLLDAQESVHKTADVLDRTSSSSLLSSVDTKTNFWTDTLSVLSLWDRNTGHYTASAKRTNHTFVMPMKSRSVAVPFGRNDPFVTSEKYKPVVGDDVCLSRAWRNKWAVHFSPGVLQHGMYVPPVKRHPRFRRELAEKWLQGWNEVCNDVTELKVQSS